MNEDMLAYIQDCARCGMDHEVLMKKFKRPVREWTHYSLCPITHEPILMKIVEVEENMNKRS